MTSKSTRYAHSDGHLDLCYHQSGEYLLTGGSDGDVRIFHGFDDDDPEPFTMGEMVYAVACKNGKFYSASSDNTVSAFLFPSGDADGLVTRFTAPASHIVLSEDGKFLAAGSSDFSIRVVELETNKEKVLRGHDAPVLSVALYPSNKLLASSSCDGTVKCWDVDEQRVIHTITGLPSSNHISSSSTLCRLTWDKDGKHLVMPQEKGINVLKNGTWEVLWTLSSLDITELVSVVAFSPCYRYLAGGCRDGTIVVWNYDTKKAVACEKHDKKFPITSLAWSPAGVKQLVYGDANGFIGQLENFLDESKPASNQDSLTAEQIADLFDDEPDAMMVDASNPADTAAAADDSDDDDDCNISKIKASLALDEDSKDVDGGSEISVPVTATQRPAVTSGFQPTPLQSPFQPSSCPVGWSHRFMLWNGVGLVLQYETEEEQSINVEFHDTATHHAMHINNTLGHTMACLSTEALLLACKIDTDSASQLVCNNFGAWDGSREWNCPMPEGEDIEAVCLGDGWLAVSTDKRLVRVFTVGGVQREIFTIPGPVVSMAAHSNQLMVVYHAGMGIPGDQCLGYQLLYITGNKKKLVCSDRLPISAKSTLSWLGFTAEGTPAFVDSAGIVQLLSRRYAHRWQPVADLKSHCKSNSSNYWVVGLHENPAQIRAILVKGGRYPGTLPKPTVHILDYKLPLCEMATDKGTLEESFWRGFLLGQHFDWWSSQGYEYDESQRNQLLMPQTESLMKLFALACKSDREKRAMDVCELMPNHHSMQLAAKYAGRLRRTGLAEKLNELTRQRAAEELQQQQQQDDDDEEEEEDEAGFRENINKVQTDTDWSHNHGYKTSSEEAVEADTTVVEHSSSDQHAKQTGLSLTRKESNTTPRALSNSQVGKKNPFKKSTLQTPPSTQGTSVFDSMEKTKPGRINKTPKQVSPKPKKVLLKKKTPAGTKYFQQNKLAAADIPDTVPAADDDDDEDAPTENIKPVEPAKTAFQLWYEENKDDLEEESPDMSEADLTIHAAKTFKALDKETQQMWKDKARTGSTDADQRKRKRNDEDSQTEEVKGQEAKKKCGVLSQNASAKLAAFAFNKS